MSCLKKLSLNHSKFYLSNFFRLFSAYLTLSQVSVIYINKSDELNREYVSRGLCSRYIQEIYRRYGSNKEDLLCLSVSKISIAGLIMVSMSPRSNFQSFLEQ